MKCIHCNSEMIIAKLDAAPATVLYLVNKEKGLLGTEHRSSYTTYVCPECGYVELRADKPKDLVIKFQDN